MNNGGLCISYYDEKAESVKIVVSSDQDNKFYELEFGSADVDVSGDDELVGSWDLKFETNFNLKYWKLFINKILIFLIFENLFYSENLKFICKNEIWHLNQTWKLKIQKNQLEAMKSDIFFPVSSW